MLWKILKLLMWGFPFVVVVLAANQFFLNREPARAKLFGRGSECSWLSVLKIPSDRGSMASHVAPVSEAVEYDPHLGIERLAGPDRTYWIKRSPEAAMLGRALMAYLLADHRYLIREYSEQTVHPGDVVVDVGAHVGIFMQAALRRGASKVIAVEPDPVNLECLRRNFSAEIQSGTGYPVCRRDVECWS